MKKDNIYREAADKIWELSKQYSYNREIMNIIRDCASELHLEAKKYDTSFLHLIEDKK
jgi:hypothetical protein